MKQLLNTLLGIPEVKSLVEAVERDPSFFINSPEL